MTTLLSIVTPAYREAGNLDALYARLAATLEALALDWEWVVVDDHSPDATFEVTARLAARDTRVRGLRLARNEGPHRAVFVGLAHARGDAAVVIAADLQDPPELIAEFVRHWRDGAQVVQGVRASHPGRNAFERTSGTLFHRATRRLTGIATLPAHGADCFLLDRIVIDALARFGERNVNLCVLIAWLGFRSKDVAYEKHVRQAGRSGWTLRRRIELLVDTVVSFSYAPVRVMSWLGAGVAAAGFVLAIYAIGLAIAGAPPLGWASLMVAVLVIGGVQMLMLGVLGEYVWRTLEEARRRPRGLVEAATSPAHAGETAAEAGHFGDALPAARTTESLALSLVPPRRAP